MYYNAMPKSKKKRGVYEDISNGIRDVPEITGNPEADLIALEEHDVLNYRVKNWDNILDRMSRLRNADDVLHEFGVDAARLLVVEMFTAKSDIRIKAIQQILDRTLGKPIDRSISVNHNVKEMKDEELDAQIKDMLHDLNYITGTTRRTVSLLVEGETAPGEVEASDSPDAGLAGEISPEQKED